MSECLLLLLLLLYLLQHGSGLLLVEQLSLLCRWTGHAAATIAASSTWLLLLWKAVGASKHQNWLLWRAAAVRLLLQLRLPKLFQLLQLLHLLLKDTLLLLRRRSRRRRR